MQKMQELFPVYATDGVYAGNAGAISCHLIGFQQGCCYIANAGVQEREECDFDFIRCIKVSPKSPTFGAQTTYMEVGSAVHIWNY